MEIELIRSIMGDMQREEYRCAQLLYFLNRLEGMYRMSTGHNFRYLRQLYSATDSGLIHEAIQEIKNAGIIPCGDIDPERYWREMSVADMEVVDSCLKYSALNEFLLIRYDEPSLWSCKAFQGLDDFWAAYGGLLQECRSAVVNIDLMEYAMLPFAKFRNLNEGPGYMLDEVKERIGKIDSSDNPDKARGIEFSEKLDGSMIQMRYIGDQLRPDDRRFWHGIIMATSGSLYPDKAIQLKHVLRFMEDRGEAIERLVRAFPFNTFIFEWIDHRDEHMVRYKDEGLHLIGVRNTNVGWQWDYHTIIRKAEEYGVPTTRLFSMSLDEALESLEEMKGSEQEGYVLNVGGFLVKIKCPDFLNLMRAANVSSSFNTVVRVAADGTVDDFIASLPPSYQDAARAKLRKLHAYVSDVRAEVERVYSTLPSDRKAAMQQIDGLSLDSTLKGLIKARYLGKPVEIIAKHKGSCVQYVRESEIDRYYADRNGICPCCMKRHPVKTIVVNERNVYKGVDVEYSAEYCYCDEADETYADERQMTMNHDAMKKAYEAIIGAAGTGQS